MSFIDSLCVLLRHPESQGRCAVAGSLLSPCEFQGVDPGPQLQHHLPLPTAISLTPRLFYVFRSETGSRVARVSLELTV